MSSKKFEIIDIPGKGKGVIATEDIKEYEIVSYEAPVRGKDAFLEGLASLDYKDAAEKIESFYEEKLTNLSEAEKREFVRQEVEKLGASGGAAYASNAAAVSCELENADKCVYPILSRFNHSCRPNVEHIEQAPGSETNDGALVVALRDIRKGEELYKSYIDLRADKAVRQKALLEEYNFTCECEVCMPANPEEVTKSDENRDEIWKIGNADSVDETAKGFLSRMMYLYVLYDTEDIFTIHARCKTTNQIIRAALVIPDQPRVEIMKYAQTCYRCCRVLYGDAGAPTKTAREWVRMCESDRKFAIMCTEAREFQKSRGKVVKKPLESDEDGGKVLPDGTDVVLFGLSETTTTTTTTATMTTNHAAFNGQCGTIVAYNKDVRTYDVADIPGVSPPTAVLALRPTQFAQKVVLIEDITTATEADNQGDLMRRCAVRQVHDCELDPDTGDYKYTLKDLDTGALSTVHGPRVRFPADAYVRIHGLQSEQGQALNERYGTIKLFDETTGRYGVDFGHKIVKILPKNLAF